MMKKRLWVGLMLCAGLLSAVSAAAEYLSPVCVEPMPGGKTLLIAEATANQVAIFDVESGKVTGTIGLPFGPADMAVAPDGSRCYVVGGVPDGRLCVVDPASAKVERTLGVGHSPVAVALSPDGKIAYVCNQFTDDVAVVDLEAGKVAARIGVARQPVAAVLTPDGRRLLVANLLPAGAADGEYSSAVVSVIDTSRREVTGQIALPNGSMSVRAVCLSPDGRYAYVTHVLGRYQLPTTQLERGWMNTNALSIIDVSTLKRINTVLLDDVDLGAANPWDVACTADGKTLCVTLAGTHQVAVIDRAGLHERLEQAAQGHRVTDVTSSAEDVPNDLAFLVGLRRRIDLTGNGPRGLAVIGQTVYAAEYFSDTLGVADLDSQAYRNARSIALGPKHEPTAERQGEMFFHDARLCFQMWQSCSSCHPADGRADGLNWDLLNDGLGNPKNTKSMLLAHQTPPAMVSGVRGDAEAAVRAGIKHIQFAVRPEEDAQAIDAYLKALRPVPSPHLVDGKLSPAAQRGEKVFETAGCAHCHPAPLYTNLKKYDVGLGTAREAGMEFDTPTLVEVWRTAPYLHDGRAVTIEEVLTTFNKDDKHGKTSELTREEIADLTAYILSL